jgi:formamidopyrimidine-DNA glycosylase
VPELPEVETIRRQLEPALVGRRIEDARVLDERWTRPEPPRVVEAELKGRRIESVSRRGKYLIVGLEGEVSDERLMSRKQVGPSGNGGVFLVMHLRMTGNLLLAGAERFGAPRLYESEPDSRFLRAAFDLDDGQELWFTDARRFGHGVVLNSEELGPYLEARLGVEPLGGELTGEGLRRLAEGRTAPLKSFLLDQRRVAGIGNIYADEALWRAELHPLSPAGSMRAEHADALVEGIVEALEAGLANGGSSIDDYRDVRGEMGSMQDEFVVHTREGQECVRCGGTIRRVVVGGRSTYFCPDCQVRLRRQRSRRVRR